MLDLVGFRRPLDDLVPALSRFPWDFEQELVRLDSADLRHALMLYRDGVISADQLEEWADVVEGRDDIAFTSQLVIDLINQLANPLLFGRLTAERVDELLRVLSDRKLVAPTGLGRPANPSGQVGAG